ncbi:hypothetical protein MRB53_037117 [Persea americana]|nr:hypothetical protein MRB53_037117 [Persea americana]
MSQRLHEQSHVERSQDVRSSVDPIEAIEAAHDAAKVHLPYIVPSYFAEPSSSSRIDAAMCQLVTILCVCKHSAKLWFACVYGISRRLGPETRAWCTMNDTLGITADEYHNVDVDAKCPNCFFDHSSTRVHIVRKGLPNHTDPPSVDDRAERELRLMMQSLLADLERKLKINYGALGDIGHVLDVVWRAHAVRRPQAGEPGTVTEERWDLQLGFRRWAHQQCSVFGPCDHPSSSEMACYTGVTSDLRKLLHERDPLAMSYYTRRRGRDWVDQTLQSAAEASEPATGSGTPGRNPAGSGRMIAISPKSARREVSD